MAFTKRRQPLRDQCSALNLLIQRLGSFWQEFVCSPHACKHYKLKCGAKRSVFSIRRGSCTSTVNRRISRRSWNTEAAVKGWMKKANQLETLSVCEGKSNEVLLIQIPINQPQLTIGKLGSLFEQRYHKCHDVNLYVLAWHCKCHTIQLRVSLFFLNART